MPLIAVALTERSTIHAARPRDVFLRHRNGGRIRTLCGCDVYSHFVTPIRMRQPASLCPDNSIAFGETVVVDANLAVGWPPPAADRCPDCFAVEGGRPNPMWTEGRTVTLAEVIR